jgi:hypothetical protein
VDLVNHLDLASDKGRDERHRRDARRGDGEVSRGVGEGEDRRLVGNAEIPEAKTWVANRA